MKKLLIILLAIMIFFTGCDSLLTNDNAKTANTADNPSETDNISNIKFGSEESEKLEYTGDSIEKESLGNETINIINGGDVAFYEDNIYYVKRVGEETVLFKADLDLQNEEQIAKDVSPDGALLNVTKDYIFYAGSFENEGIYRLNKSDNKSEKIYDKFVYSMLVVKDEIYIITNNTEDTNKLIVLDLDGKNEKEIDSGDIRNVFIDVYEGNYYYTMALSSSYKFDLKYYDGSSAKTLFHRIPNPYKIADKKIYCYDDESISYIDMETKNVIKIINIDTDVEFYNIAGFTVDGMSGSILYFHPTYMNEEAQVDSAGETYVVDLETKATLYKVDTKDGSFNLINNSESKVYTYKTNIYAYDSIEQTIKVLE